MTSNDFIESMLKECSHFRGCFHVENIPQTSPLYLPASFIIYSKNHWTSVMMIDDKICLYFDSLAQGALDSRIINFLSSYSYIQVKCNKLKIQDDNSNLCGLFSILFVKSVSSIHHFINFLKLFHHRNLCVNDDIVTYLLSKFT